MTILWSNAERNAFYNRSLGSGIGIELKVAQPIPYNENPTPIQELIERQVTNGRGYVHLRDSLNIVNNNSFLPKLTILCVLDRGLIPLYLTGPREMRIPSTNPCGEIPLGEPVELTWLKDIPPPTLLEQIGMQQRIHWMEDKRRKDSHILFSA